MSTELLVSLMGLAGVVVGALLVGFFQLRSIRAAAEVEFQKLLFQNKQAIRASNLERKKTIVVDKVSKVLEVTDLEVSSGIKFSEVVKAVNDVQLLLDPSNPLDLEVSKALNEIAEASRAVLNESASKEDLLSYQARLTNVTQKLFNSDA